MTLENPRLWIDCDGTAVAGLDPRSLSWRLFSGQPGFVEFLHGVQTPRGSEDNPDALVEIAGILTMRPILLERLTRYEVKRHGLKELIPGDDQLRHVGSDGAKANVLVAESEHRRVGMLEDGPHRLVPKILSAFALREEADSTAEPLILLGAVNHGRSDSYMNRTLRSARSEFGPSAVSEFDGVNGETGHRIKVGRATLDIVQLEPYTEESGRQFGSMLLNMRAKA
jgi:hypothetical protein